MKLIRHRLVGKREDRQYEQVGGERFTTLLIHKAYEELHEIAEQVLLPVPNREHLIEELADLTEVMSTIADWFEVYDREIEDARVAKAKKKGTFLGRWVIL